MNRDAPAAPEKIDLEAVKSLLLVRLRSLGDCVLMTPLISALKSWRRELRLSVLVERALAAIFEADPEVDSLLLLEPGALGKLALARRLSRTGYDLVLNLHGGNTSHLLALAARARWRLAYSHHRWSWLYDERVPEPRLIWGRRALHTVEHQLAPLKWLGIPLPEQPALRLHIAERWRHSMAEKMERCGAASDGYLLVHPGATLFTKQWEEEKFARLIEIVAERYRLQPVVVVGSAEKKIADKLRSMLRREAIFFEGLELGELMALIDKCLLYIGNDSGPTHIAAALGRPVVVIFGSSDWRAWHPWNSRHELVRSDLPCQPCPGYRCYQFDEPLCIRQIEVERVAAAVEHMFGGISGAN